MSPGDTKGSHAAATAGEAGLGILVGEADSGARRLARQLKLSAHDREDVRHELLVDLLVRTKSFVPARGTLGAFAGVIVRHCAARIAKRLHRERRIFVSEASLYQHEWSRDRSPTFSVLDHLVLIANDHEYVDRRIDLARALLQLTESERDLCAELLDNTPSEIGRARTRSRATVYRQIGRLRTRILKYGLAPTDRPRQQSRTSPRPSG
jgi:DNA-directed RNA polymerase specialized sigma24 family protein